MTRSCATCQHLKRPEIDRRLAAGEPSAQVARDYELNPSSLHRHRVNCLKLAASNAIKKDAARGSAAAALLPSKETLSGAYFELRERIDRIVSQAEQQGSLTIAISGLNSVRHTLDSLVRLAGHDRAASAAANAAAPTDVQIDTLKITQCLIEAFDHEPDIKARIAQALATLDDERAALRPAATSATVQPAATILSAQAQPTTPAAPSAPAEPTAPIAPPRPTQTEATGDVS